MYLEMMEDPQIEAEFILAEKLGMTVSDLRDRMTHYEFLQWNLIFSRRNQAAEMQRQRQLNERARRNVRR